MLAKTKAVSALWQAHLLRESRAQISDDGKVIKYEERAEKLYNDCVQAVENLLLKSIEKKDWLQSYTCLTSLNALGIKSSVEKDWTKDAFLQELTKNVQLQKPATSAETKVSQMIHGTVTVWVDLGLTIQKGVGYANKMLGSGFFIDSRGYIVTNHHVIEQLVNPEYEGYARLTISLAEAPDVQIPAKVVGFDKSLDLALLKTEATPPYLFALGSSSDLDIGDKIYAIGSPLGFDRTITSGIISAKDRKLLSTANVMQIDAAINAGNSGGPTIDEFGNVQAIVFAGVPNYEGLNFAIPVEYLKSILPRLYAGGAVKHVWCGVYGRTAKDDGAKAIGVEVLYVKPGSSAAKTGIVAGDIVTSIDGKKVTTIEELQDLLLAYMPGTISTMVCQDASTKKNVERVVYWYERPEYPGYDVYASDIMDNYFLPIFGMQLVPTSAGKTKKYYVERVIENTVADDTHFASQDKIQVTKVRLSKDSDALTTEVYAQKRRNGYVDIFISLSASLDSPAYF